VFLVFWGQWAFFVHREKFRIGWVGLEVGFTLGEREEFNTENTEGHRVHREMRDQAGRRISQSSSPLKKRMAAATHQAMTVVARELTKSPILARSLVNCTSGITANGN
jgi:hypothetical protein